MAAIGRPSEYTDGIGDEVCRLIESGMSLSEVERAVGVDRFKVFRWLEVYETFRNNYTRARLNQADAYDSQIQDNVTLMLKGEMTPEQCRVANDSLKWMASKRKPSVYGDKLQVSGNQGLTINIVRGDVPSLPQSEAVEAEFRDIEE